MRLAIVCGLSDYKLTETLKPLQTAQTIRTITLIRRKSIKIKGVKICMSPRRLSRIRVFGELWRFARTFWMCLRRECDCLMGIHYTMHCVYAGLCGVLFNIPYVMMIVEDPRKYKAGVIFRFFVKNARAITVRGNNSKKYLITECGAKEDAVYVLRDPMDLQCHYSERQTYDFVFVGNMVKEKRPDILIDVFADLKKQGCTFKAAIIGRGPLAASVKQAIDVAQLGDMVEYLGYVDDVFEYLSASKCFVMTSQTEGMPTVLLEAFQCGLPAIVPDVGDITDVVEDGVNGRVVKFGDVDAYVRACRTILTEVPVYEQYRAGVQQFCLNNAKKFKQSSIVHVWDDIVKKAILS